MDINFLGRPLKEAVSFLEKEGYTVRVVQYQGRNVIDGADDLRVIRQRINWSEAELVVSLFRTSI